MLKKGSSVSAMETMIKILTQFQVVQQEMEKMLKQQYEIVGEEWDDIQYKKLGYELNDIYANLSSGYAQVSECITKVQLMKRRLEQYLEG